MERTEAVKTFEQALRRLQEVLGEPESALVRDAAITRFEFTYELAWKAVQRVLREQGVLVPFSQGVPERSIHVRICSRQSTVDSNDRRPQSHGAYL